MIKNNILYESTDKEDKYINDILTTGEERQMSKKVKVTEQFLDLEPGSVLILNEKTNKYEWFEDHEEVSAYGRTSNKSTTEISPSVVEAFIGDYFEYEQAIIREDDYPYLGYIDNLDWSNATYVKPLTVQCIKLNDGRTALRTVTNEVYVVESSIFDKLFKIIQ